MIESSVPQSFHNINHGGIYLEPNFNVYMLKSPLKPPAPEVTRKYQWRFLAWHGHPLVLKII